MKNTNKSGKKTGTAGAVFTVALVLCGWILVFLAAWVFTTWRGLRMDELIFQLRAPIEGTGDGIILRGVLSTLIPAFTMTGIYLALLYLAEKKKKDTSGILILGRLLGLALIFGASFFAWKRLELGSYVKNQMDESTFIEDNYVDPAEVSIRFPQKKRNLIYIFLESMEMTYADPESGGAFPYNNIPELTEISMRAENFSGDSGLLNGGRVMPGTTFTMGGMFAQTAGLPLKLDLGEGFTDQRGSFNKMNTQDSFFKKVTSIGDILKDEGYNNVLMLGSNATFGGRRLYFGQHGSYEIDDYNWAVSRGIIPEDYYVFWGMEDRKLFQAAKDRLAELGASDEPFNLTLLTVDTHFEDGYMCDLCQDQYPDNHYANVMACSSRQVADFVSWVQQQDFYENTTIVLCGDHTTMDSDFCIEVPDSYNRRVYTSFINADAEPEDPARERAYTTFDQFPTTLAALGCRIDGDRLGLGTNLFSGTDTLLEKYGFDKFFEEMEKKSQFMIDLADIDMYSEDLLEAQGKLPEAQIRLQGIDKSGSTMTFTVSGIDNIHEQYKKVLLRYDDGSVSGRTTMTKADDETYTAELDTSSFNCKNAKLTATVVGNSGRQYDVATMTGDLTLKRTEICDYLDALAENPQYTVLIALRDDGSHSLNSEICSRLARLGLKEDIRGHYRWSYYALIEPDGVTEELSESELSRTGSLADGAQYTIISQGGLSGAGGGAGRYLTCSIKIDGVEYAVQRIGLNFVVYDTENSCVVDSVEFNTYMGLDPKRIDVTDLIDAAETAEEQMEVQPQK